MRPFKKHNVVNRFTGASYSVVLPADNANCIGIGFAGCMKYYKVINNSEFTIKLNKASLSARSNEDLFKFFSDEGWRNWICQSVIPALDNVKTIKNPFPKETIKQYPELA